MSGYARVRSIDVLQITAAAVQKFRGDAARVLDEIDIEARRAEGWIHHDRKEYWARELRRSEDAVTQARLQLQQARTTRRVADRDPACDEEKRILARAIRRHETAQRKVAAVQRWTRAVDHAIDEYQRVRIQFQAWLEGDLVKGVAALDRMSASLESYTSLGAPTASEEQLLGQYAKAVGGVGVSPDERQSPDRSETDAAGPVDQPESAKPAESAEAAPAESADEAEATLKRKGRER